MQFLDGKEKKYSGKRNYFRTIPKICVNCPDAFQLSFQANTVVTEKGNFFLLFFLYSSALDPKIILLLLQTSLYKQATLCRIS